MRIVPAKVRCDRTERDWVRAGIRDEEFYVAGGLYSPWEVISTFLRFARRAGGGSENTLSVSMPLEAATIDKLQSLYDAHCGRNWQHAASFTIKMTDRPGWAIRQRFDVLRTTIDDPAVREWRSEVDWIEVDVVDQALVVGCSLLNLGEGIERCVALVKAAELVAGLHDGVRWLPGNGREEGLWARWVLA